MSTTRMNNVLASMPAARPTRPIMEYTSTSPWVIFVQMSAPYLPKMPAPTFQQV
ncbi:hypothetical protein [Nonomuraea insulae]|uniref:Uncharacterized protein n=1 Tax=Nonomuraea insulae TaxID=1616787 RepID=A0ABW1CGU9_9ACTN